jgi:hypothetical protein
MLPYCRYLLTTLLESIATAADASLEQPHLNKYTVFSDTWHAASLARLGDADIASLLRLADYLMLDAACGGCLEDVVVQRQARTGVLNRLIAVHNVTITKRLREISEAQCGLFNPVPHLARGIVVPVNTNATFTTAKWGHWDLLLQAQAAGVAWDDNVTWGAACGGHLRLLQQLRQAGCPWHSYVVQSACQQGHDGLAIWALEHGAPTFDGWLAKATLCGRLPVLQWAWSRGRLPTGNIPVLRHQAVVWGHGHIVAWLDEVSAQEATARFNKLLL